MALRTKSIDVDGESYKISEVPGYILRLHTDLDSGAAQCDMMGICILNGNGEPMGKEAEQLPLRVSMRLLSEVLQLSGLVTDATNQTG